MIILPQTDIAKTFLLEQAREHIGQDLQIQHMNLAILPNPRLQLSDVTVKNVHPTLESLSVQSLDMEVSVLPLLFRTIVFNRLVMNEPQVIVNLLQEDATVSAPSSKDPTISPKSSSFPLPLIEQLKILKGRLTLRKMDKRQRAKEWRIEDIQITSDTSSLPSQLQLSAKTVNSKRPELRVGFSGIIEPLPPQNSVQGKLWGNLPPIQLVGDAEVSNFDLSEFEQFFEFGTGMEEVQNLINLKTPLTLFPDMSGISLVFSDLQGHLGNIPIRGKGSVSGIMGHEFTYFSSLSSSPISVGTLRSLLPASILPLDLRKTLDDHKVDGKIELVNSTIAGSSADSIGTSIMEEIRISQGHVEFDTNLPPLKNLSGTLIWENGELRLNDLAGNYQSTKMTDGQADIQFNDSGPWLTLQLRSHTDVQDILHAWTTIADRQAVPATVRNLQGSGNISVRIHGPLQEPEKMEIESIHLDEGHFSVFQELPPIHHVSGTLNMMNDRLIIQGLKAQHGSSKILDAEAIVQFQTQGPWAQVEAKTLLNLQVIKKLIAHIEPTLKLPKTVTSIEGKGNLSFRLQGPLNEFQKIVIENAQLHQGRLQIHPDLPPIHALAGTASYKNDALTITDFNAAFRSSQIHDMSGTVKFGEIEPEVEMTIHSTLAANDIVDLIQHVDPIPEALLSVAKLEEVTGGGQIQATIQGPLNNPAQLHIISGEVHLEDVRFRTPHLSEPIEKLSGKLMVSENELSISEISGQIGKSQARLQGTIGLGEAQTFRDVVLDGHVETIDIKKIWPGIVPDALQGSTQLKAVISGNHDSPDFTVHADLKDVQLDFPDVIHKPAGMPASFQSGGKIQNQRIIIVDHAELDLPHLELFGNGTFNTGDPFAITATVETAPVSLVSLPEKMLFGIKKFTSGDLTLSLDVNGTGNDWEDWQIKVLAKLEEMVEADSSPEDPISNLLVDVKFGPGLDEIDFTLEAMPVKNIAALAGMTQIPLEGDIWLNGILQGRVDPNRDPIPTLGGKVDLLIKDGRIHPGPIVTRIISFLNLPALLNRDVGFNKNTLPFTTITGGITIEKGILHTENLILNSPVIMLSTMGEQDLPADQIDLVVAASPLGSYTKILKNIPFVNKLFGEGDAQLLTVFFEVKGPYQKPKVRPLPFKSVEAGAKGLIDLGVKALKDTAKLPQEILKSFPGQEGPSAPTEFSDDSGRDNH